MTSLREDVLIRKGFTYWLLPNLVIGIIGIFFPLFYELIPVHQSETCLCSFYASSRTYWLIDASNTSNFLILRTSNTFVFIVVNWIFLTVLIWMVWRIRNIQDKTLIKQESAWIVAIWVLLSFLQYVS